MAAEYSRELSVKVFNAQKRLVELGWRMGSIPGYGLRRLLICADGKRKIPLKDGQRKSLAMDHVVLIPGPEKEVKVVRTMFAMALRNVPMNKIARWLNDNHLWYLGGRHWTCSAVGRTLRNPKYKGTNIWNRLSCKLHTRPVVLPVEQWIIKPGAFAPVIDPGTFDRVQKVLKKRLARRSDEELLNILRRILRSKGKLSEKLILASRKAPSTATYHHRLGNFREIYKMIGFDAPASAFMKVDSRNGTLGLRKQLFSQITSLFPQVMVFRHDPGVRSILRFEENLCVSVVMCPHFLCDNRRHRWKVNPTPEERNYTTLLCILNRENTRIARFYVLPNMEESMPFTLKEDDPWLTKWRRIELHQLYEAVKASQPSHSGIVHPRLLRKEVWAS
jgi:hypothetical protein